MKLKPIKPGMAIHCTTREQVLHLVENKFVTHHMLNISLPLWFAFDEKFPSSRWMPEISNTSRTRGKDYYESTGFECVEFTDLIIQELSAEEIVPILTGICRTFVEEECCGCPLNGLEHVANGNECPFTFKDYSKAVEICTQWKADHEKKEPEIKTEWIWQGIIYRVETGGEYYQLKDNTGFYDTGCESQESAEEFMADKLKAYCKTRNDNYVATVRRIGRVKGRDE